MQAAGCAGAPFGNGPWRVMPLSGFMCAVVSSLFLEMSMEGDHTQGTGIWQEGWGRVNYTLSFLNGLNNLTAFDWFFSFSLQNDKEISADKCHEGERQVYNCLQASWSCLAAGGSLGDWGQHSQQSASPSPSVFLFATKDTLLFLSDKISLEGKSR